MHKMGLYQVSVEVTKVKVTMVKVVGQGDEVKVRGTSTRQIYPSLPTRWMFDKPLMGDFICHILVFK